MESLEQIKKQINILDYIQNQTGITAKRVSKGVYNINPCPICRK